MTFGCTSEPYVTHTPLSNWRYQRVVYLESYMHKIRQWLGPKWHSLFTDSTEGVVGDNQVYFDSPWIDIDFFKLIVLHLQRWLKKIVRIIGVGLRSCKYIKVGFDIARCHMGSTFLPTGNRPKGLIT